MSMIQALPNYPMNSYKMLLELQVRGALNSFKKYPYIDVLFLAVNRVSKLY